MKKKRFSIGRILFYTVVSAYAFITLGPFIWSIITSLKPASDVGGFGINPSHLSFKNYTFIWKQFPFARWAFNSLFVATVVTFGNMIINSMTGYALARIQFPGKKIMYILILAMMMVPGQVVLVPTYILLTKLGWVNHYEGLTIPYLYSLFGIFLMRQFFLSIPKSIEEAALIDGLGRFGIFFKIVLPMAVPALTTQFILMFTGNWNSFLIPSLLTSTEEMFTLPVGLNSFYGQYFQFWNQVMAGVMILSIPTIVIFIIFQRNFIKGVATTGIKE